MPEILEAVRVPGIRLDSLGNYLAALGLMQSCSKKWPSIRGLWSNNEFVIGASGLNAGTLLDFLLNEFKPTKYERWWGKGSKELARLRSWEPDLNRVKILDAHIVAKGTANVYNDILGTGGNVGKRDFTKVFEVCKSLTRHESSPTWLQYTLFGASVVAQVELPDLPSTGTWFASANKAFNSGFSVSREGQLSPWSYLFALEGALLLRGGAARRLGARAAKYGAFPFVSEAASPETPGEMEKERSEFWAPIWDQPATILELKGLLSRGQARIGNRAARSPFDFAAAAFTAGAQAGLIRFDRFCLRQTTSANTYEAIASGSAPIRSSDSFNETIVQIADWAYALPADKTLFAGLRSPVEKAMLQLSQHPDTDAYRNVLFTIARIQRRVDLNRNWRASRPISKLRPTLFKRGWPEPLSAEVEIARAIASIDPAEYGVRHNIFGLERSLGANRERFADPRPASAVWHDGDPMRALADVLERRLIDAPDNRPPLQGRQFCSAQSLDQLARGLADMEQISRLLPALSLIEWPFAKTLNPEEISLPASPDFLLQGYFRPLFHPRRLRLLKGSDPIVPDAIRARALARMIRAQMWQPAFDLAEKTYRSCGLAVLRPPKDIPISGDRIAACLLIPVELVVMRKAFRRWLIKKKKGQL